MVKYKHIIEAIDNYNKSYSHKPHLQDLPYDLTEKDPKKLKQRLRENNKRLREAKEELKDAQEMDEMMEQNIKEIEENEKLFQEDIQKMEEQNAQIKETIGKVYDHFEEVTMMTEEDGWNIKKSFDEITSNEVWSSQEDNETIDNLVKDMETFINETSLQGYISPQEVRQIQFMRSELEDLTQTTFADDLFDDYGTTGFDSRDVERLHDDIFSLTRKLDNYCEKYDISKDTPLRRQLDKIESDGNLSDKWYMVEQRNNNEIKKINNTIEKENERKEGIIENQKENRREMGKIQTRINDHEKHKVKIEDKIKKVSG